MPTSSGMRRPVFEWNWRWWRSLDVVGAVMGFDSMYYDFSTIFNLVTIIFPYTMRLPQPGEVLLDYIRGYIMFSTSICSALLLFSLLHVFGYGRGVSEMFPVCVAWRGFWSFERLAMHMLRLRFHFSGVFVRGSLHRNV
ncbi:hypothetical protein FN846DRAFT_954103 [Sphaerosporella brunnea]|uniref:Uncharacterized protein n=1 Tax=Sphaerosporella brunnea TaxID=1250544 RepID=A0A5J5EUF6_9PEZI|nr:hypothetical protein FN846DRAFT_954103 [Sphaerosporella brunnea]